MPGVAHAVHEAQRWSGKNAIQIVVLDHDGALRDPRALAQDGERIIRVVQHVHEKNCVEAPITERNSASIKADHLDVCVGTDQNVDPFDRKVGPPRQQLAVKQAVAAAHVEHARALRDESGKVVSEHAHPPGGHVSAVDALGQPHFRPIPRMLTKKLEKTVWNPSAVSVAPGMTQRIVRA